jgi:D-methionine transport system ATP-binding protein
VLLRIENVGYTPANLRQPILADISSTVDRGEIILLTGATGAGKSTLLKLINRLQDPTSGSIYLEDRDYRSIDPVSLRRRVMLVSQEPKLLGMNVRDALAYPLQLRGIPADEITQRSIDIAEQLAIPNDLFDRVEAQLSTGQKQLIAIARGMIAQPDILLLDEPIANLDRVNAERLFTAIAHISKSIPITTIAVIHQLELGVQFSNRIWYLQSGRLLLDRSIDTIDLPQLSNQIQEIEKQEIAEWE